MGDKVWQQAQLDFVDILNENFITQHIDYSTLTTVSMPDLVLSSEPNLVRYVEDEEPIKDSDHVAIGIEGNLGRSQHTGHKKSAT